MNLKIAVAGGDWEEVMGRKNSGAARRPARVHPQLQKKQIKNKYSEPCRDPFLKEQNRQKWPVSTPKEG